MKKLFFILFLAFAMQQVCSAKDSTIVFKFAAGVNYYNPINTNSYNTFREGYGSYSSLAFKDTAGISFIIKAGVQKRIRKALGADLSLSYSTNKADYTTTSNSNYYDAYSHTGSSSRYSDHYVVKQQNFTLSAGLACYIHQFYIMPKLDLVYTYYPAKITTENTIRDSTFVTTSNTSSTKTYSVYTAGGGLAIGYNFKIRKKILSLELQSDYYIDNTAVPVAMMNAINASFLVGFAF